MKRTGSSEGKDITSTMDEGVDFEVFECDKTGNIRQKWLHKADCTIEALDSTSSSSALWRSISGWRQAILDSFLPVGFPHSVSDDYLAYQTFDSLQAFFSTITSLLASRAILEGLGVGDANSSATFAMLLTILTDGMSRVATIIFAHRFGLRIEPDAKRYRFLADLFIDTAFFLDLYSPYLGSWGKVLALGTGAALKSLCGVAAGASKAALSVHFARHDNLAELNAKEASQETAIGLIGLLVGTLIVKFVENHTSVMILMIFLTLGHLWVNYLGVCSVHMNTFNQQRATILFSEFLATGKVLSPKQVAQRENILFWDRSIYNHEGKRVMRIEFAESYPQAAGFTPPNYLRDADHGYGFAIFSGRLRNGLALYKLVAYCDSTPRHNIELWLNCMGLAWNMDVQVKVEVVQTPDFWNEVERLGWDLNSHSLETGPPVRIRFQPAVRKDQ